MLFFEMREEQRKQSIINEKKEWDDIEVNIFGI